MIKRKDGSYSQRGLWDNIRANRGSGKKPTAEMLRQEKKIKSKMKDGGKVKVKAGGENHVIYKKQTKRGEGKVGNIMVNHPTMDKGKWDTIDLTAMNKKINTVKEGVAATKKWHRENPYPKKKMQEGGEKLSRKEKREAFREKVSSGEYDIYKKNQNISQRETSKNILSQPRSETGMGRRGKIKEAAKATGWDKSVVRKEVPTAFREKVVNPLSKLIKKSGSGGSSGILPFPGIQGCSGGGCKEPGKKSAYKKGGMTPAQNAAKKIATNMKNKVVGSDRMLKHGGKHSKLKQAYLNKYK